MKVISEIGGGKKKLSGSLVAVGVFDGIHLGHQALLKTVVRKAKKAKAPSVVITFWPHPRHVLAPGHKSPLLINLDYRMKLLEEAGIDYCLVIRFTKAFARMSPKHFIEKYLQRPFSPSEVFVGSDFRFGSRRQGGLEEFQALAKQYGFRLTTLSPVTCRGARKISSTRIREYVARAEFLKIKNLLGRRYGYFGIVQKGAGRGRGLGFPTINIYPSSNEALLPFGVYAVKVRCKENVFFGACYIGRRPSFKEKNPRVCVEVFLFDFQGRLYKQKVLVEFYKKIRGDRAFASPEKLKEQIEKDTRAARKYFKIA